MTIDISSVLNNADKDRKISITERKGFMDVICDIQLAKRNEKAAKDALLIEGAQAEWEKACGANKVKAEIDLCFDKINNLNRQLVERGVKPVKTEDRLHHYFTSGSRCYGGTEVSLKIGNKTLKKKYDGMQATIKKLNDSTNKYDATKLKLAALIGCSTVGEIIGVLEEECPEMLGVDRQLTHKAKA